MKTKKNLLSLIIALCLCMALAAPALAAEEDFYEIANNIIQTTEEVQESGALLTTYENLDIFANEIRSTYPEVSDFDLASFIMEYTGHNIEDLDQNEILDILEYNNISTSSTYLLINDEENTIDEITQAEAMIMQIADPWVSNDKLLKIETDFSKTKTVGSDIYYTIWARATWLVCTPNGKEDVLVLGCSYATSDDSFNEQGFVNRSYSCKNCGKIFNKYNSVDSNTTVDGDLSMNYANYAPYIRFLSLTPYCDSCLDDDLSSTKCSSFKAYIKYAVIVNGNSNIQATYGHKLRGTGNISVGLSADGIPSVSISPQKGEVKTYSAKYITLK